MQIMQLGSNHNIDRLEASSLVNYLFLVFVLTSDFLFSVLRIHFLNTANILLLFLSVAVALIANRNYLKQLFAKPILFWFLWVVYAFLGWMIVGIRSEKEPLLFILTSFVYPIITMCIVCYEGNKNLRRTTLVILVALSAYIIAGLFFQDGSVANSIWDEERGGQQLGNTLALKACVLTFVAMFAFVKEWIDKKLLILLAVLSLVAILYAATRKAFVGWMIVMGVSLLGRLRFNKPLDWLKMIVLLLAALFVYNYLMEHTYLGVRMQGTVEQGMKKNDTEIETLNYLGDRSIQYIMAWDEFRKHPVTGIGIHNFQSVTGFPFRLHTEYMVQLCECGIVGVALFLLFVLGFFRTLFRSRSRIDNKLLFVCWGGFLCILFINLTAWTYSGCHYFAMYGLILAASQQPYPAAVSARRLRTSMRPQLSMLQLPVPRLRILLPLRHVVFVLTERVGLCVRYMVKGVSGFVHGVGDAIVGFMGWCRSIPLAAYGAIARLVRGMGSAIVGLGAGIGRMVTGVYGAVAWFVRGVGSAIVGFGTGIGRAVTAAYGAVCRFGRNIGSGIVAFGTTLLRSKGILYALASVAALVVVGWGIWFGVSHFNSLPHFGYEPESQVAEVSIDTAQVPDDLYEDELDYSTVVEDNTGRLLCVVPENWENGFDLVISWRCATDDVCFQIRPVGTERWTTMHYNETGKSSDILPFTMQKEFLAKGKDLEWRLFARFPDNTTVVKTGQIAIME